MVSDPKATIQPGTDLTLHWAGNGHIGNGQSDGTCVKVMVAPFDSDPAFDSFNDIPGGECLDFSNGSQQPQGTLAIPNTLAQGSYTLLWYWTFTEFTYSACVDIDITDDGVVTSSPSPESGPDPLDDGEIQVYLHNGCGNIEDSTQFCQQYTREPNSFCLDLTDECGRSICDGVANFLFPCPSKCPVGCPVPKAFYDDFSSGLDETKWLTAEKSWGSVAGFTNGGVVAENVVANITAGTIIFNAHGNYYDGYVTGINKDLSRQTTGVRTGGAIATRQYFGAGSYEVKMKIAPELGVSSAIWTFFYNDDDYCRSGRDPIVNHEIDIELPGRPSGAHTNMDFSQALMNTWIGEIPSLYEPGYTHLPYHVDDDAFHTWRFDWHTDPADPRVEFYLDDTLLRTMQNDFIPFYAGRLWIGAWFPSTWAGVPNFAEAQMEVDYVKFTPFDEVYECPAESYPEFGWSPGTDVGFREDVLCGSSTASPVPPSTHSPNTPVPSSLHVSLSYLNDGCSSLSSTFCSEYNGGYCKDGQTDSCGRSICQGSSHSALNSCSSLTPTPTLAPTHLRTPGPSKAPSKKPTESNPTGSIYRSQGCTAVPDSFCYDYNRGYCKSWQFDGCGRSVCHGDSHSSFSLCP